MKNEIKVLLLRYYKILNLQSWETSPNQLRPWEIGRCYALISAVHSAQPPTCNIHTTTNPHNHHSAQPPTCNIHSFPKLFWEKGQSHLLYDSRAESNNHKHYIYLSYKMCIYWFACWNSCVMLSINLLHTHLSVTIVVMMIKTLIASTASSSSLGQSRQGLAGSWGQDTDQASIFWGVSNVSLRASGFGFKRTCNNEKP